MNLYEKKIVYLHREGGDKAAENCGFASFQCVPGGYKLTVQIRQTQDGQTEGEFRAYFVTYVSEECAKSAGRLTENQVEIGKLHADKNSKNSVFCFCGNREELKAGGRKISISEIWGIRISLNGEETLSGSFQRQEKGQEEVRTKNQEKQDDPGKQNSQEQQDATGKQSNQEHQDSQGRPGSLESKEFKLIPDKWEQLKQQYELVHPFGDEREFILVKPADFVILRQQYQKLVSNSFLLYGYFNYRHVILGKDVRLCGKGESCFYLGVPGVFYEREKMVAVMFGFEGFEARGSVENGKFGYYLRKVEI